MKLPLRSLAVLATASLTLGLAACGSDGGDSQSAASGGGGSSTLKVATIGIGSDAAIQLAADKGYFKAEGLDVQTSVVANPPAGIAAAQSGQIDLTYTPSIPLINALSQNVGLKVVASADGYSDTALAEKDKSTMDDTGLFVRADSGVARPKDLEGKSVSVPARKAQLEVTISKVIKDDGGDPSKVNWMVLDPASALQSLQQKRIDGAGLVAPFTGKAKAAGNTLLSSPGLEFFQRGAVGLWVTGESTAQNKQAQIAGFARAIKKANAYANAHLPEAQQVAATVTKTDLAVIKQGADNYWPAAVKDEDLQRVNANLVQLGFLPQEVKLDGVILDTAR